jgi:hypothetical protein
MGKKRVLLILIAIIILCAALYYYGFVYAFRNFSGSESWRPLSEYALYAKKDVIQQSIYELDKKNSFILVENNSIRSAADGFSIAIIDASDTVTYHLRIPGNDSIWNSSPISKILLMKIEGKGFDISYSTLKKTDKKGFKKMISLFESKFIDSLKNVRNPG